MLLGSIKLLNEKASCNSVRHAACVRTVQHCACLTAHALSVAEVFCIKLSTRTRCLLFANSNVDDETGSYLGT